MTIKQFIDSAIEKLKNNFPTATLRYEYQDSIDSHMIEITPTALFESDKFLNIYADLTDEFYENDLDEIGDFGIVTDTSLVKLENPIVVGKADRLIDWAGTSLMLYDGPSFASDSSRVILPIESAANFPGGITFGEFYKDSKLDNIIQPNKLFMGYSDGVAFGLSLDVTTSWVIPDQEAEKEKEIIEPGLHRLAMAA